jgi:hypothetical protein
MLIGIEEQVKSLMVREGFTMKELVERLTKLFGTSSSLSNFSNKLTRGSLRYNEAQEIAEALGYEIVWKKKAP